ncbi:DUF2637 domain-containing protein [Streptomyces sp. NPDC056682]|uniref:DUF2637 domain-containing protein n=1 Tax=Streptomyces sp. NPDC056682 TaxID=3345909 RepID=UPI0036B7221A
MSHPAQLTRTHRILIGVVVAGAVVIAGIGFAGSYAAVRELALHKGFGNFSYVFPIGVDAGICVLLALDLLLTWMRIPFPLLRQTAWLLTAATIAFNGAAAWPDPLGVGMHAVIPVLFVVSVEAARHAVGRIADITADKHMEGVRLTRWLLSPIPTFRLWRRMKLWELRSYEQVIKLEQDRLVYRARLQSVYGRAWRRKAPVESLMPLRLAKYGVPLAETAPAGLAAAGMEPVLLPSVSIERTDLPASARELDGTFGQLAEAGEAPVPAVERSFQPDGPSPVETEPVAEEPIATHESPWFTTPRPATPSRPTGYDDELAEQVMAVDHYGALRAYVAQHNDFPTPAQFGFHLVQAYGITDPATGGPLTEDDLEPVLAEFRRAQDRLAEELADVADTGSATAPVADGRSVEHQPAPAPRPSDTPSSAGSTSATLPLAQPHVSEPVLAPTASVTASASAAVPQQSAPMAAATNRLADTGEPTLVEGSVSDTGAATARVPEQQRQEPELDPLQQQIVLVAQWLAEAEDAGKKLSGAEVGRRLGVAPRTGQRRIDKAAEYREGQQRQQGRSHLRSVTNLS